MITTTTAARTIRITITPDNNNKQHIQQNEHNGSKPSVITKYIRTKITKMNQKHHHTPHNNPKCSKKKRKLQHNT